MNFKQRWIFGPVLGLALSLAVAMLSGGMFPVAVKSAPAPASATTCPPYSFVSNINLAKNPSFEVVGPGGAQTSWQMGGPNQPPSAANQWLMHSSNSGAKVTSNLIPTNVPGPGGNKMLHFIAGGNEGGIYQTLQSAPSKVMFSVWVFVRRGHVAIQPNGGNQGPSSWSTKHEEWEQLRVCTDGTVPTGMFVIWNEDPGGGEFFADRAEIRETP